MNITSFDKNTEQSLRKRLDCLQQKGAVLGYYQLLGLLFAVACSPEKIQPSEWFDLIWLNDDPQFDDEQEARQFYHEVLQLSRHVFERIDEQRYLPFSVNYSENWQQELADWCDGMLIGHHYLEDLWSIALDDLDDPHYIEDVDASLCLALTFADLIKARQLSLEQGVVLTDEHFPEAYSLFWKVLGTYASIAWKWTQLNTEQDLQNIFESMTPVARNKLCPCGSGLMFAKCCLH